MNINSRYIVVEKVEEKKPEGFQAVEIQDSFVYKGVITMLPNEPKYIDDRQLKLGDVVWFFKYSPDSVEIDKKKFIKESDILAVE